MLKLVWEEDARWHVGVHSRREVRRVARAGARGKLAAGKVARLAQAGCAGQLARPRQQHARPRLFAAPAGHVAVLPRHHLRGLAHVAPGVETRHAGVRHTDGRADASSSAYKPRALLTALACARALGRGEIEAPARTIIAALEECNPDASNDRASYLPKPWPGGPFCCAAVQLDL